MVALYTQTNYTRARIYFNGKVLKLSVHQLYG